MYIVIHQLMESHETKTADLCESNFTQFSDFGYGYIRINDKSRGRLFKQSSGSHFRLTHLSLSWQYFRVLTPLSFIVLSIHQNDKLNLKSIILPTFAALTLLVSMMSAIVTLPQSASAFHWACIDRSDGKAPMVMSDNNLYVAWWGNGTGNFEVMFKASNDNGQTFGDKINLSNSTNGTSIGAEP